MILIQLCLAMEPEASPVTPPVAPLAAPLAAEPAAEPEPTPTAVVPVPHLFGPDRPARGATPPPQLVPWAVPLHEPSRSTSPTDATPLPSRWPTHVALVATLAILGVPIGIGATFMIGTALQDPYGF